MEETWKDIPGYEGLYRVSNYGNVLSLNYRLCGYSKQIAPKCNSKGYLWVLLYGKGKGKPMLIHRLVALAFLPNPNNYPQINHKDENPKNNHLSNLEWCTASYNVKYTVDRHPGLFSRGGGRNGRRAWKYGGRKIVQLTLDGNFVREWADIIEIQKNNFPNAWSVTQCCNGNRKTAYGFKWRFADEYNR